MTKKRMILLGASIVVGFGAPYCIRKIHKRREKKREELERLREEIRLKYGDEEPRNDIPDKSVQRIREIACGQGYLREDISEEHENPLEQELHPTDDEAEFDDDWVDPFASVCDATRLLDEEEYCRSSEYASEHMTYYDVDDVLVYENEDVVFDREEVVGDALSHFGYGNEDPDVVFVRNERFKCDYEITRRHEKFGIVE